MCEKKFLRFKYFSEFFCLAAMNMNSTVLKALKSSFRISLAVVIEII